MCRPVDDTPLKTIADFESLGAVWISYKELLDDLKTGKKHLRGNEPLQWFEYVHCGGPVYPMSLLTGEVLNATHVDNMFTHTFNSG